ncbi:MAG: DUF4389 domain-containing protein [Candidatus Acetothermia bacterium]|nr:DUF4389 domain-containing protein [Candidatus Acetothermia bacterium]MDH7506089.1 DUF4389 domain-containing protein [Candidatus Acetothermia bacterium]
MSAGRIVLLIFGVIVVLVVIGLPFGGGAVMVVQKVLADSEGFISTRTVQLERESHAIVSEPAAIDIGLDWPWRPGRLGTMKVEATAGDPARAIFLGLAEAAAVRAYLADVAYDEIVEFKLRPLRVSYRQHPGGSPPAPPATQRFWEVAAQGAGPQTLRWEVEPGEWVLVLMNADGSAGLDLRGSVGVKVPWLFPVGLGLFIAGLVVLAIGIVMIYLAVRRPAAGAAEAAAPAPSGHLLSLKGELEEPLSPWLWVFKWFLLIPHYIVLAFLWAAFAVVWVIAFFAILFTGRYPRELFEFSVGVLRWTWRVGFYSYQALGTDKYPPFTLKAGDYPADLELAYPERLSRGLVLVKWWLLALPQYLIVAFFSGGWGPRYGGLVFILALFAGVALLFRGRYPRELFDFVIGMNRWGFRVLAYAALLTDRYPPFRLGE